MDIKSIIERLQMMKESAEAKHMKTKAVTGKQSKGKEQVGTKKRLGKTVTKKKSKPAAKGKDAKKKPSAKAVKKQSPKTAAKGKDAKKKPSAKAVKKPSPKTAAKRKDPKKKPSAKAVKKQSPKSATNKKTPKKKNAKKQSTKAAKDVDTKKTDKKKPKQRLPSFGSEDTVVLMLMGASGDKKEKSVFKNDMKMMQKLFEDERYFGVRPENIISVSPSSQHPNTTNRGHFMKTVKDIQDRLKKKKKSRLIFYYTGHFSDDRSFWIENAGTPDDDLRDEDLKKAIATTSAEYIILILDCCFSGKAEIGAKRVKKTYGNPPVPQLWDIGQQGVPGKKGTGSSRYGGIRKAVQLCSSTAGQTSGYGDRYSFFTETIYDVVTKPSKELKELVKPGSCASVLQIFREVKKELIPKQKAEIRPTSAYREQYYESFPGFTKIKIRQKIPTHSASTAADGNEVFPQGPSSIAANVFNPSFELNHHLPRVTYPNESVFSFHPYNY